MNVQTIRLTSELNEVQQAFAFGSINGQKVGMGIGFLRSARKVGDTERVNHYQLGQLKRQHVPFEIVE